MKVLISTFIIISSFNIFAQSNNIEQSTPFKNVLTSLKSDSVSLFISCFSDRIVDGEDDEKVWMSRLNEGKENFEKRFGNFEIIDFSYEYEVTEYKLVVYYKNEEQFRMRVVQEDGIWKLDEK